MKKLLIFTILLIANLGVAGDALYYYAGGKKIYFSQCEDMISIKWQKDMKHEEKTKILSVESSIKSWFDVSKYQVTILQVDAERASELLDKLISYSKVICAHFLLYTIPNDTLIITDELIVKFKSGLTVRQVEQTYKVKLLREDPYSDDYKIFTVFNDSPLNALEIANILTERGVVQYACPNFLRKLHWHSNDTWYSNQWALPKIDAPLAWRYTTGSPNIIIAVLDNGVDLPHLDLSPIIVTGTIENGQISSYPQGVVFGSFLRQKLFALWTEKVGSNYYLVRKIINLPPPYANVRTVGQSDIPEATAYNNSRRLIHDANNVLHLAFTSGDNIYHTCLQDTGWSTPVLVGAGRYPALCANTDNRLYSTFALNTTAPDFREELCLAVKNGNSWTQPMPIAHNYYSYRWGIGAPSFVTNDSMGYFVFETAYGSTYHQGPDVPFPPIVIIHGYGIVYGKFPLAYPEDCQWQMLDTVPLHPIPIDTSIYQDSLVNKLISPSITVDAEGVVHILWEGMGDSLYYYQIKEPLIIRQVLPGTGIDYPFITMRGDQIDHIWCAANVIKHRYGWTGITALSGVETIAECENPFSSGSYLTWTKKDNFLFHLYYGVIPASGAIEPIEINYSTDLIAYPQILFNPKPASLDLVWTEYSLADSLGYIYYLNLPIEEPPPLYAFDMGQETPVPICIQRDGFMTLGPEDYQTFDYDSTELVYHLTLHSPHTKYKIRWTYYHQELDKLKLQLSVDDILHHNRWVNPGEIVVEETYLPDVTVQDNEITIRVKVLEGTIAVFSGLEIETEQVGGGGPMGEEAPIVSPFFFAKMYPNPTKGVLKIRFNSPDERKVTIKLYDVSGRLVQQEDLLIARVGMNEVLIKPEGLSAGVYFVSVETIGYKKVEKAILLK